MGYTRKNLVREVENQAPNFGMPEELEARFARSALGGETLGLSLMRLAPGFRVPFGRVRRGRRSTRRGGRAGLVEPQTRFSSRPHG